MGIVSDLERLAAGVFSGWDPRGYAPKAARDNCRAAWSNAILAASRARFTEAREHLETARRISEGEGAGFEEVEALRLLDPGRPLGSATSEGSHASA